MGLIPLTLLEKIITLFILFLESTPPQIRTAQALVWWYLWWPVMKLFLKEEQEKQIEAIVATVAPPADVTVAKAAIAEHKAAEKAKVLAPLAVNLGSSLSGAA